MTTSSTARPSPARERLLRRSSELFYREGIRAVGVDRLIGEADVTRATFYRHFPSKDDLVVAYLQATHDAAWRAAAAITPGADRLRRIVAAMGEQLCSPGFRGCAFLNAVAEFPDPTSPVRRAVAEHRAWLMTVFAHDLDVTGHPDPAGGAAHLMMLRDGAMVAGYLADAERARTTLARGLETIIEDRRQGGGA